MPTPGYRTPATGLTGWGSGESSRAPAGAGSSEQAPAVGRWSAAEIEGYREFVRDSALGLAGADRVFDCADWTLTVLIEYARRRRLPVRLRRGAFSGLPVFGRLFDVATRDPGQPQFSWPPIHPLTGAPLDFHMTPMAEIVYRDLEREAHRAIGAADVDLTEAGNTVAVRSLEELRPGDMVTMSAHAQLVYANPGAITAAGADKREGERRVLEVLQGNLPAVKVEHRAWDLDAPGYFHKEGRAWTRKGERNLRELWTAGAARGRRWNFEFFNLAGAPSP